MMKLLLCILLLLMCIYNVYTCLPHCGNDTELVMTFLVTRHGDRTPMESELVFSKSPEKLKNKCKKYGFGELTNVGKARSFDLGKLFRTHYDVLLSPTYDCKNVYVHSTDFTRTIMTAKIALTAAYCPEVQWSENLELLPVECNVVPVEDNVHVAFMNCPRYKKYFFDTLKSKPETLRHYPTIFKELTDTTTVDLTEYPMVLYSVFDLCVSMKNMGIRLSDCQIRLWDKMEEATTDILDILEGKEEYIALQAGGLLNDFHDSADLVIAGVHTPKFRLYSTHKFNVYSFLVASRAIPRQKVPKYCSVAGLELRKIKSDGRYVVTPIFISSPEEEPVYLEIEGCGYLCDFVKFKEMTLDYILDQNAYKEKCQPEDEPELNKYKECSFDTFATKMFNVWNKFKHFFF